MNHITVSTLGIPPAGWYFELDVEHSTTVATLKETLAKLPDGPHITTGTKLIHYTSSGSQYMLLDTDVVRKKMFLTDRSVEHSARPQPQPHSLAEGEAPKEQRERPARRLASVWPSSSHRAQGQVHRQQTGYSIIDLLRELVHAVEVGLGAGVPSFSQILARRLGGDMDLLRKRDFDTPALVLVHCEMVNSMLKMSRSVLRRYHYEESVPGLMSMDTAILCEMESEEVHNQYLQVLELLTYGERQGDEKPSKFSRGLHEHPDIRRIWMGIWSGTLRAITTWTSYIHHLGLAPLERRLRSTPRTMAFIEQVLKPSFQLTLVRSPQGPESAFRQRNFWILNATDMAEGQLARDLYFEELAAFDAGEVVVGLVGDDIPEHQSWGSKVKVVTATTSTAVATLPPPTIVFSLNTGMGSKERECTEFWVRRVLFASSWLQESTKLPPLLVFTCRSAEEARVEKAVLDILGANYFMPTLEPDYVRNIYSGMAGHPDVDFDENGWWIAVCGSSKVEEMLKWLKEPEQLCLEVARQLGLDEDSQQPPAAPAAAAAAAARGPEAPPRRGAAEEPAELPTAAAAGEKPAAARKVKPAPRSSAVFWGILDLKYDAAQPLRDRVKVLETGDGRASRFSGYGAAIKERFQNDQKLEETIQRGVLTENKKLTHDTIVGCGYGHLLPTQAAFLKEYKPDLAQRIQAALKLKPSDVCILKLCNRARGAGVVPVQAADLDEVLSALLRPPEDIAAWFSTQAPDWYSRVPWGCLEEQLRHWWSNECPVFLVEDFCTSGPIEKDGQLFDGTMRVAFSLHREMRDRLPPGWVVGEHGPVRILRAPQRDDGTVASLPKESSEVEKSSTQAAPRPWDDARPYMDIFRPQAAALRVEWLGGYWKLPVAGVASEDLRGRIVSVAKQGTAPVRKSVLHDVYACLGDMVAQLFNVPDISHAGLSRKYSDLPELAAFASARLACSIRLRDKRRSNQIFQLTQASLSRIQGSSQPKEAAASYIYRNCGVNEALKEGWSSASRSFSKAIEVMPTNATARFLLGLAKLEMGEVDAAAEHIERSLLLDPDFKAPYVNLGVAYLRGARYQEAADVSLAGLTRHPSTPQCLYNLGVAKFTLAYLMERANKAKDLPGARGPAPTTSTAPTARRSGEYGSFRVEHDKVAIRARPSTQAPLISVVREGHCLRGIPHLVGKEPWLLLDERSRRAAGRCKDDGWVLMDGKSLGLGLLLTPDQATGPAEVVVVHQADGAHLRVRVPGEATILDVRWALAQQLGKGSDERLILSRARGGGSASDSDLLGATVELFARGPSFSGVASTTRAEAWLLEPPAPPQEPHGPGRPSDKLRAEALEALTAAKAAKPREASWTANDEAMVAALQDERPLSWSQPLPNEGWKLISWRP